MINKYRQLKAESNGNDEGFTLIELLIVIVILGILAAVVVFAVGGITDRGKNAACKSDVKTFEVAAEAFNAKTGAYPTTGNLANLWTAPNQFMRAPGGALAGDVYTAPAAAGYVITYTPATAAFAASTGGVAGCPA